MDQGRVNGKASAINTDSVSRKYKGDIDGKVSLNSFLKTSPFLSADGEEEEEMVIKPHSKSLQKGWRNGDESSKLNSQVSPSARELFEECFGKWKNVTCSQGANSDLDTMAEEIYLSRKQDKASAFAAALAKRELAGKLDELSPDMDCKARKMAKSPSVPSPTLSSRRNSDREMFMGRGEDSSFVSSRKQEAKCNIKMDFLGEGLLRWANYYRLLSHIQSFNSELKTIKRLCQYKMSFVVTFSSSDMLAEERQLSQDLVQSSKKDQEFRSIFQHVQAAQLQRSPSELFAQHIVTIVHHIKGEAPLSLSHVLTYSIIHNVHSSKLTRDHSGMSVFG